MGTGDRDDDDDAHTLLLDDIDPDEVVETE